MGEDECVELDEEGKPRPKSGPKRRAPAPKKKATVVRKAGAAPEISADARAEELVEADPEESAEAFMARREAARNRKPAGSDGTGS